MCLTYVCVHCLQDKDFDPKPFMARLRAMRFKCTYVADLEDVLQVIETIHTACKEVLDSANLKEFLVDIVRPFGNKLNPNKRPVSGVKMSSLSALANTRGNDGKPALYYIMGRVRVFGRVAVAVPVAVAVAVCAVARVWIAVFDVPLRCLQLSKKRAHLMELYRQFPTAQAATRVSFGTTQASLNKVRHVGCVCGVRSTDVLLVCCCS